MTDWLISLAAQLRAGLPVIRITVLGVRGSAPREAGACMLVCDAADPRRAVQGSIGGGHLEWKAVTVARQMLAQGTRCWTDRYTLGASLGQCCGGAVELGFERYEGADLEWVETALEARSDGPLVLVTEWNPVAPAAPRRRLRAQQGSVARFAVSNDNECMRLTERLDGGRIPLYLYGAGHVGTALVQVLAGLPVQVTWVDSREDQFGARLERLPDNVMPLLSDQPDEEVEHAPADAWHLIMTHSHDLDYAIGRALLERGEFAWAGLIGSDTKAASFTGRWERQGLRREDIARIACPIGLPGIAGKHPGVIAVSVAAQLQQLIEARAVAARPERRVLATLPRLQPQAVDLAALAARAARVAAAKAAVPAFKVASAA